jgi:hypothetical protein
MVKWLRKVFKACIESGKVSDIWKRSRTVILYKRMNAHIPLNWRRITITFCLYRLFMSLAAQYLQEKALRYEATHLLEISERLCFGGLSVYGACGNHERAHHGREPFEWIWFGPARSTQMQHAPDWIAKESDQLRNECLRCGRDNRLGARRDVKDN